MACFAPIMQYHSEFNHHRRPSIDRTPWNILERTGEPRVLEIYRRYARLRERLVPYLVEQAARSVATDRPLMRTLFFDWPDNETAWDFPLQYMLGDDLLVAPVTEPGATEWTIYLPAEGWVDAWTGDVFSGPATIARPVPIDEIPVFIRSEAAASLRRIWESRGSRAASLRIGQGEPESS